MWGFKDSRNVTLCGKLCGKSDNRNFKNLEHSCQSLKESSLVPYYVYFGLFGTNALKRFVIAWIDWNCYWKMISWIFFFEEFGILVGDRNITFIDFIDGMVSTWMKCLSLSLSLSPSFFISLSFCSLCTFCAHGLCPSFGTYCIKF